MFNFELNFLPEIGITVGTARIKWQLSNWVHCESKFGIRKQPNLLLVNGY